MLDCYVISNKRRYIRPSGKKNIPTTKYEWNTVMFLPDNLPAFSLF
ncbi:hypothetical protein TcasGA2_TC031975 [Tribolium castaneum]|uniref:Uncharacterized protein n=1 Tax=Tribolium castaneum TaxID=7070 RepID=A0A139WNE6_TRICA|nr:hypothetical protein TcasGA2_TC031975 [Tribolium castaneum]